MNILFQILSNLSDFYIYVQLFHSKGDENNLLDAIKVKFLSLHPGDWGCSYKNISDSSLKVFATELFIYVRLIPLNVRLINKCTFIIYCSVLWQYFMQSVKIR